MGRLGVPAASWKELEHCDPVPHYDWADALFLPSAREGAPLCLLEAQARGLPVFSYAIGEIPGIAKGQGIVSPQESIVERMVGTTPAEYARMSASAIENARPLMLEQWRETYGDSFKTAAEG